MLLQERAREQEGMSALIITAIYLLAGGLWILFSDGLLQALVSDPALLTKLQTFKGWFYVLATGLLLFMLIRSSTTAVRNSTAALRRNEEELQKILNTIPARVFVTDLDDHLLRFNSVFARATGLPSDRIVGKLCSELFRLADPETHRRNDQEIVRTGKPKLNMVERIETGEGAKWFDVSKMPLLDENGKAQGLLVFAVEITEQKLAAEALRESQRQLQPILDNTPCVFYLKDLEGRFQLVNRSFELVVKTPKEDILGKTDYDVFPAELSDKFRRNDQEVIETGLPIEREEIVGQGDAEHIYLSVKFPPADSSGVPYALCGISTEITERKRAGEALAESEARFRTTFENSGSGIALVDMQGQPVKSNPALQKLLGYTEEELSHMTFTEFTHVDDRELDWRLYNELVSGKRDKYEIEKRFIKKDGQVIWGNLVVSLVRDTEGVPKYAVGMVQDITERKRAEEKLLNEQWLLETTVGSLPGTFYLFDEQGKFIRWNHNLETLTGYTADEVSRMGVFDFVADEDRQMLQQRMEEVFTKGEATMEADLLSKDGRRIPFVFSGKLLTLDHQPCIVGIGIDITKPKQAEAAIEDRERRLNLVYQNVADCLYVLSVEPDERYRFISVNEAFLAVTGFRREQVMGKYIDEVLPETSHELVRVKYREAIEGNKTVRWEEVAVMPAGRRIGEVFITPALDEVAGRLYLLGGVHDVTERIEGEEALRESENRFRMLAESYASAILYHLEDGTLAYANPAAERMTGYSRDELLKLKIWDLLHPDFRMTVEEHLLARQDGDSVVSQNEVRMIVKSGETRSINYTAGRVATEGSSALIAMVTDVTERKRAEEELRASHEQLRALRLSPSVKNFERR
jgi:PAS domain S-box-containing protein